MFIPFATSSRYIAEYYNMVRPLTQFGNLISIHFGLLESDLHGSANDPRTANDPGPQMIPKLDHK